MAKPNPFAEKGAADAKKGGAAPMLMKGKMPVKAHTKAGMHGKGMVAPPARKAK